MSGPPSAPVGAIDAVAAAEPIGSGEYVHVYRGRLAGGDEPVRLLVLSPAGTAAGAVQNAFERRSEQWERVGAHPNVASVRARGERPRPWLAVEAVDGDRIGAAGPALSTAAVRSVVADAAEALRAASRADLYHGALSPGHVWVCRGDSGVDGQIDWGVERACRVAASEAPMSPYTAPELADDPAATERADVYALGGIAYTATTGSPPAAPSFRDQGVAEGGFSPPAVRDHELPPRLDAVLSTALAAEPSDRYPSAYAFKLAVLFDAGSAGDSPVPAAVGPPTGGRARPAAGAPGWTPGDDSPEPGTQRVSGTDRDSETSADEGGPRRRVALGMLGATALGGGLLAAGLLDDDGADDTGAGADPPTANGEREPVTLQAPAAEFEFTHEDGSLTVTHAGSDAVSAGNLVLRGEALDPSPLRWSDTAAYGADDQVVAGDSLTVDVQAPGLVVLRWDHGDRSVSLDRFEVEAPTEVDPPVAVEPPEASFAVEYDGDAVRVSHETGDGIPAIWLQFRGSGFAAAPAIRWSEVPGVDPETVVEPGTAIQFDASDEAVVHLFWKPETRDAAVLDGSRQMPLAQFYGPARPLDPTVGGVPTGQYDAENTGFGRDVSGPRSGVAKKWLFDTGALSPFNVRSFTPLSPSPAVSEGFVYAGGVDDTLYAVDAVDGAELWRAEAGPLSAPSVADGTVYVAGSELAALDATDGSRQWLFESDGRFLGRPQVADGTVYVASGEPFEWAIHAVEKATGSERWRVGVEGGIVRTPAVVDDTVYFSAESVRAHATADGTERWTHDPQTVPTAPAAADGTVYVGETAEEQARGFVSALDRTDGTEQWRQQTPGALRSSVAIAAGTVYAAGGTGTEGYVLAADAADGTTQWVQRLDGLANSPPVVADGTVYVADNRRHVVALEAATGRERWRYDAADELLGPPVVANDTLYVVGREHVVHALADPGTE